MDETPNLDDTKADLARAVGSAVGKVVVGTLAASIMGIPVVGGVAAEIVGSLIPNQRLNRIADFLEILGEKLKDLDADVRDQRMKTEEFVDLFEDAMWQAARALTRERKEEIAAFLKHSLYHGELDHIQEKTLLSLLNQLNNAHILILRYHSSFSTYSEKQAYLERHRNVVEPPRAVYGDPEEDVNRYALAKNYRSDLQRLGLLRPKFDTPRKGEIPEFDPETGAVKAKSFDATRLGYLLLHYIGARALTGHPK